jgi:hypothetical protein
MLDDLIEAASNDYVASALRRMEPSGDPEADHRVAEDVLLETLEQLGNGPSEVAEGFRRLRDKCCFWYA